MISFSNEWRRGYPDGACDVRLRCHPGLVKFEGDYEFDNQVFMNFKDKLERFSQHRRLWGTTRALNFFLGGLLQRLGVSINYVFVGADDGLRKAQAPEIPPGYETRLGTYQDFVDFDGEGYDYDLSAVERYFANGDRCAVTFCDGAMVGYRFNTIVEAPVTEQLSVRVPDGFIYAYKAWIHAKHRRKNLDSRAVWVINQSRPADCRERDIWYIATHNYPSLLHGYVNPKARSLRMGLVGWVTLFGKQLPFSSRGAKWLGFEFHRHGTFPRQYM